MGRMKGWLRQLRALFRKDVVEREMKEEMAFHLRMETEENIRRGMTPAEARRAALVAFGGVERFEERVRDARWTRMPEALMSDLRHAARRLRRRPTFTVTVVATLALGLAALGTAYGVAYGVLLRPLPFPDGDALVRVWQTLPGWSRFPVSYPAYERWRDGTESFTALAAYERREPTVTGGSEVERVLAAATTANLPDVLGLEPVRGRWFSEEEDRAGARVAVLSHRFWTGRLGGDADVIGRTVRLDDEAFTVVGVMPADATFPSGSHQLWLPLGAEARERGWDSQSLVVVGRLAEGRGVEEAALDVGAVTERFVAEGRGPEVGSSVASLREASTGGVRSTLLLALAAASAVLLIGALNVANLFLTRGAADRGQAAVRVALGAGRGRLARGMVMEGVLVAVGGAIAGLAIVASVTPGVAAGLAGRVPRLGEVAVDAPVVAVVLSVAAAVGVVLGLVATWAATAGAPTVPGSGTRGTAGRGARLFRSVMVGGQVAAVLALLSGAGLLILSLDRLLAEDRGFAEARVIALVEPVPLESRYPDQDARDALFGRVASRMAAVPGITGTALVAPLPFSGSERNITLAPDGWDATLSAGLTEASAGAFDVLGVPLLAGRTFAPDEGPAAAVAVVGEGLARRLHPDGRVVGMRLPLDGTSVEIIGVVGDVRQEELSEPPAPRIWVPYGWSPDDDISIVMATAGDPALLLPDVRTALLEVEPTLAAERLVPMDRLVGETTSFPRFRATLLVLLGLAATTLAAVGVYGVTSYAVVERRRELSIRTALGARGGRVVADVLGYELRVVALGLLAGLPASLLVGSALRGFLYDVAPDDPRVHGAAVAGILVVGALAALVPALRAVRADPAEALRVD